MQSFVFIDRIEIICSTEFQGLKDPQDMCLREWNIKKCSPFFKSLENKVKTSVSLGEALGPQV